MSNVTIPFGDSAEDTAVLLLAAAESLGQAPGVITTGSFGNFFAPVEVAEEAGVSYVHDDAVDEPTSATVVPTLDAGEPDRYLTGTEDVEPEDTYNPGDYTVEQVLEFLSSHPDLRDSVIAAEREGKNRVTITESE